MRAFASLAAMTLLALVLTPTAAVAVPVETTRSTAVAMEPCSGSGVEADAYGLQVAAEDCGGTDSPDCGHRYTKQGDPYTVTATSYWVAQWQGTGDISGTIELNRTAETQIVVGEAQVITQ